LISAKFAAILFEESFDHASWPINIANGER